MDIQAEKIELAKMVLNTNDISLLNKIKSLFGEKEEDWWNELPLSVKDGIKESIAQAERGELIPYEQVKKDIYALLRK